ncbi:unnamed protein product, partial [Brenthis ino]
MEAWKIEGTNILITGGASGLGAAYVEAFLKCGAKNIAILDIAEKAGKELTDKLNKLYKNKVIFVKCDVSKDDDINYAFDQVLNTFNRIDVIINNAGIMNDSPDVWKTSSLVNWVGLVSFTMKGIQHMRKDEGGQGGTIINISSSAAIVRVSIIPIYCGTKSAVLHFGRSISSPKFNSDTGIRILTICLGATDTELLHNLEHKTFDDKTSKAILSQINNLYEQRIESAVAAFLKMYREGAAGSVWLSANNKPGRDITSNVDVAFSELEKQYKASEFGHTESLSHRLMSDGPKRRHWWWRVTSRIDRRPRAHACTTELGRDWLLQVDSVTEFVLKRHLGKQRVNIKT